MDQKVKADVKEEIPIVETGEKRKVLENIFLTLQKKFPNSNVLRFDNDLVKQVSGDKFRNQFDVTKCDTPQFLAIINTLLIRYRNITKLGNNVTITGNPVYLIFYQRIKIILRSKTKCPKD